MMRLVMLVVTQKAAFQAVQAVQGLLVICVNLAKYVTHRACLDCSLKRRAHEQASNKKVYTCLNTVLF